MGKKVKKNENGTTNLLTSSTSSPLICPATRPTTPYPVGKQEVISMAQLEVVSEASFLRRREGITGGTCAQCLKERCSTRGACDGADPLTGATTSHKMRKRRRSNKAKPSRVIPRASSPIVVHLEDSIKATSGKTSNKSSRDVGKSPLAAEIIEKGGDNVGKGDTSQECGEKSPSAVENNDAINSSLGELTGTPPSSAHEICTKGDTPINDRTNAQSKAQNVSSASSTISTGESGARMSRSGVHHRSHHGEGCSRTSRAAAHSGRSLHHRNKETVVSLNNTHYYSGRGRHYHHHQPHHHIHQTPPANGFAGACRHHRVASCCAANKNFNAFLSAIERVHRKDPRSTSTRLENLVEFAREKKDKLHHRLNNCSLVDYCNHVTNSAASALRENVIASPLRHKSHLRLLHDKNVELICNNLSRKSSLSTESSEDDASSSASPSSVPSSAITSSDESESASGATTVTSSRSSGGSSSSSGATSRSASTSSETDELTPEELRCLTQYVTGYSVTKYDCSPDECPECLAAYYDFLSACSSAPPSTAHSEDSSSESDLDTDSDSDSLPEPRDASDAGDSSLTDLFPVTVKSQGKVEISVAKLFKQKKRSKEHVLRRSHRDRLRRHVRSPPHHAGVYVDLEDSDVSLSIEYHGTHSACSRPSLRSRLARGAHNEDSDSDAWVSSHRRRYRGRPAPSNTFCSSSAHQHSHHHDNLSHATNHTNSHTVPSFWDWFYYPLGTYGWLPYSLPYCLVPMYYLPYQLYTTIPKPIMVPRDTPCLNSQRLCYVPAQEIKNFTASQPPQRPWLPLAHPERNKPIALYTVMCYNVLCDKYATRQLYGYCPSWALNWEYRKKGIIEEIRHYSADIISLQEVETDQFYNFFMPELKRDGYDGIFSPKSRARTMSESERKHVDGCAIFFKTNKFSLIKEHLVEFNQLAMTTADGSHDMLNRVMTKDNIGIAALFETKEDLWANGPPPDFPVNQPILVSTCHVHWDPEFSDVKLIQTMMLMSELKNILDETQMSLRPGTTNPDVNNIPMILCGDLNSLPGSGVLEFLTTSRVSTGHVDFKDFKGYDACLQKLTKSDTKDHYTHSFKLAAAYSKDVIPYTNYTYDFKGVIDYIFYSRESMRPLGVLGPMDENWFTENKVLGCPHPHIPSDHLPLLVEIEMQSSSSPGSGGGASQPSSRSSLHNNTNSSARR